MNISKILMATMATLVIGVGSAFYVSATFADNASCVKGTEVAAESCARCGDGVCARSCETATSCPRDCAPNGDPSK